jgi:hypothetical protein
MPHAQLLNATPTKIGARGNADNDRRHNAEGGRGLQPAGTVAAASVRDVVGDISDSAACLTSNLGPGSRSTRGLETCAERLYPQNREGEWRALAR